jgi:hypothetical protein
MDTASVIGTIRNAASTGFNNVTARRPAETPP